jgi:predicted YcjX-like family ATPase
LAQIAAAMRPKTGFLGRLFGSSLKVLYAATKADHLSLRC